MSKAIESCFHCTEPIPSGCDISVELEGQSLPVCCHGCKAVAEFIQAGNLEQYYRFRDSNSSKVNEDYLSRLDDWLAFDQREAYWGELCADGNRSLPVLIEGLHCAACIWLLRTALVKKKGVKEVQIDLSSGFAKIIWSADQIKLSELMQTMQQLGYQPHLMGEDRNIEVFRKARNKAIIRLLVAGLGMMQVMTYTVGLYAGDFSTISDDMRRFLEGISLLVATPVVFFSGQTFFIGAWNGIKARRPGMDLPVAIALILAWSASIYNYMRGEGALYFDSVVMFVFLLLLARFLEFSLRRKSADLSNALSRLLPEIAYRLQTKAVEPEEIVTDKPVAVPIADLVKGDLVLIPKGHTVPVDGEVVAGKSLLDEAFLSGESLPRTVVEGQQVLAGSVNLGDPISIRTTACGEATAISALGRTLLEAQLHKPKVAETADRIASWFVSAVLLISSTAWVVWQFIDPTKAFDVALATLVVTCPCALSLATPASLAAASRRLMKAGLVIVKTNAIDVLAGIQRVVFDKTGTLTQGKLRIEKVNALRSDWKIEQISALATAMERQSEHPLATAFADLESAGYQPQELKIYAGQGIEAKLNQQCYRLGELSFVNAINENPLKLTNKLGENENGETIGVQIFIGDSAGVFGQIILVDEVRPEAAATIRQLQLAQLKITMLSGDSEAEVARIARLLNINDWQARKLPENKLEIIRAYQQDGERVLMVGDGVNDAPVLAGADVSMAMGSATHLAKSSADFIVTANSINTIVEAHTISQFTSRIIKQNLGWSLMYNLLAVPLAVSGFLDPWMAVIGMSLSSIVVILNAMRISRVKPAPQA
ncbi:MAG: heavy metal translocating P-type ATPase [Xanthomonadales bacterium]|nr:heavy metal translocating P-type ATPase [Xanthomonadales bacterium]